MCARLNQVRAWPQRGSGSTKCQRTWIRCALAGRGSHAHFRPERLHARSLCRRCTHSSQPCTGRISSDRPRDRLRIGVIWTRGGGPLTKDSKAAAQLANNDQRGRHSVRSRGPRRCESQIIREADGQVLSRGNRDHDRGPGAHRCGPCSDRVIQRDTRRGRSCYRRAATVAPHRHR